MSNGYFIFILIAVVLTGIVITFLLQYGYTLSQYQELNEYESDTVEEKVDPSQEKQYTDMEFKVTAYCPCKKCCGEWSDGFYADGTKVGGLVVAADRSIPLGTIMDIPGYGTAVVRDRGGAIKGARLDVYFDTHQEALNWGVHKKVTVRVYE